MAEADKKEEKKDAEAAVPPPAKSKKMIFVIGGIFLLLILIGVPVAIFATKQKSADEAAQLAANAAAQNEAPVPESAHDEDELQEGEEPLGAIFPLDTFVVNLAGAKYIRAQIQLEFNDRDVPKRFYSRMVPIRDSIITLLTSKTAEDLGSEKGKETLRTELKDIVNEMLRKEEVKKIYFTQFVIQ